MTGFIHTWPQQATDDLRVDCAYRENLSGQSLNAKFADILPVGVYRGFDVVAGAGLTVSVGSAGRNAALVEIDHSTKTALTASLKVGMPKGMTKNLTIPAGAVSYVVLKVFYRADMSMPEADKTTASIEVVSNLTTPENVVYLVLATITTPNGLTQIAQQHIVNVRKIDLVDEQQVDFNTLPMGAINKTYTVAKGSGALAGEFTLFDTETGGLLKFLATNTKSGKASINVQSVSENMPVSQLSIVQNGADIELRAKIVMSSPDEERIYSNLKAFDAHNESSIGWVMAFAEAVGSGTSRAVVDTVFVKQGAGDLTVADGLGGISSGNSGMVTEFNKPLAQRYLGLEAKAKSAATADSSGTAANAGDSSKLGGLPAKQYSNSLIDHGSAYGSIYLPLASDPDEMTESFAVLKHANCPTGDAIYFVSNETYGSGADTKRLQKATLIVDDPAAIGDAVLSSIYYRWVYGDPADAGALVSSVWDSNKNHTSWQGEKSLGNNDSTITTAQFLDILESLGAFHNGHWVCRGTWSYGANNNLQAYNITVNGQSTTTVQVGLIELAGCVIEVYGTQKDRCTIRITTPTTQESGSAGSEESEFVYVNNGEAYQPKWRRVATVGSGSSQVSTNNSLSNQLSQNYQAIAKLAGDILIIDKPDGGQWAASGTYGAGAIRIELPQGWTGHMVTVDALLTTIYGQSYRLIMSGQLLGISSTGWGGAKVQCASPEVPQVYFTYEGGKCVIYIAADGFLKPSIVVDKVQVHGGDLDKSEWESGWSIARIDGALPNNAVGVLKAVDDGAYALVGSEDGQVRPNSQLDYRHGRLSINSVGGVNAFTATSAGSTDDYYVDFKMISGDIEYFVSHATTGPLGGMSDLGGGLVRVAGGIFDVSASIFEYEKATVSSGATKVKLKFIFVDRGASYTAETDRYVLRVLIKHLSGPAIETTGMSIHLVRKSPLIPVG